MPDVTGCNGSVTVYSPSVAGHGYEWFVAYIFPNQQPPPPVQFPDGSSLFLSNAIHNRCGMYSVYYKDYLNGILQCVSNTFNAYVINSYITITTNSTILPATLSFTATCSDLYAGISHYQWYKNNSPVTDANSATLQVTAIGEYYLEITDNCGTRKSNKIDFCPTSNILTNYTYPAVTVVMNNQTINYSGLITVPEGAELIYSNCTLNFTGNGEMFIKKSNNGNNNGGKVTFSNCVIQGCAPWAGIFIEGVAYNSPTNPMSASLEMINSTISDAKYAIYGTKNAHIYLEENVFNNNYYPVIYDEFPQEPGIFQTISQYSIKGNIFNNIMVEKPSHVPTSVIPLSFPWSSIRPMIYMKECRNFYLELNQYNNIYGVGADIVYVFHDGGTQYSNLGVYINGDYLSGIANYGVYSKGKADLNIYDLTEAGDIERGIYSFGNRDVLITNSEFYSPMNNRKEVGLFIEQPTGSLLLEENSISSYIHGVLYLRSNGGSTDITRNTISYCDYGIVYAPVCNPINQPNSNCNSNYYSLNLLLHIACNKLFNNNFGIVGTGKVQNFEYDPGGGTVYDWSNFFSYSNFSTTSINGDMAWFTNNVNTPVIVFDESNPHPLYWVNGSILLDGTTLNSNNWKSWLDEQYKSGPIPACRGSFKRDLTGWEENTYNETIVYPNPFYQNIYINPSSENTRVKIYNSAGKLIYNQLINEPLKYEINTTELSCGIYFVMIENGSGINTRKMVKL